MDVWFFDENLGHREIAERAAKEFGVTASHQTLTAYFRYREQMLNVPDGENELEPMEEDALATRVGAGMSWDNLEAKVLRFATMAAYELTLVEPGKMRVKEVRSLMKIVNEHHRLVMDRRLQEERLGLQRMGMMLRLQKNDAKMQTKEEFERTLMESAEMLNRAKRKSAECRAELGKLRRDAGMEAAGHSERKGEARERDENGQTQDHAREERVEPKREAHGETESGKAI